MFIVPVCSTIQGKEKRQRQEVACEGAVQGLLLNNMGGMYEPAALTQHTTVVFTLLSPLLPAPTRCFPLRGYWSCAAMAPKSVDFFTVAVHELGHSLGLSHSPVSSSIMFPYYKGFQRHFQLDYDDILAMYQLYSTAKVNKEHNTKQTQYGCYNEKKNTVDALQCCHWTKRQWLLLEENISLPPNPQT
ncbi:unnamed protein product [Timema podura]|uniref:Peptidase M10 metallopeptidase domain-containing protein n=1 Tax=Timema podura TaxID=61482 RepID=A0ABN7P0M0_TIMPD|nr:unnamed protein product [Timema podura]